MVADCLSQFGMRAAAEDDNVSDHFWLRTLARGQDRSGWDRIDLVDVVDAKEETLARGVNRSGAVSHD